MRAHFLRKHPHLSQDALEEMKAAAMTGGLLVGALLAASAVAALAWHWISGFGASYAPF